MWGLKGGKGSNGRSVELRFQLNESGSDLPPAPWSRIIPPSLRKARW